MPQTPSGYDRHRLLVEAVSEYAIVSLDLDGHVVTWNSGAERLTGYPESEILGEHVSRFHSVESPDPPFGANALAIALREGRYEGRGPCVRKDGSLLWVHVVIHPILGPDQAVIGFAQITRDMTEQRRTEDVLMKSEEQFRLLVQGVSDYAIYMLDLEGRVTSWNLGAEKIKGYRPGDIIGQSFSVFYTSEDRLNGEPQRGLAIATSAGRFENEGWRCRQDGSQFWASVVIDAIYDEHGRLYGFAKITRDITEKRAARQALDVAREALLQSQKMDALGQLTGGIAHDFNNLLTAIVGSLNLLRKHAINDAKMISLIDLAMKGANRGAWLAGRMLAFARRQDLILGPVEIGGLVGGMAEMFRRTLGGQVNVDTDLPADLHTIEADFNQMELALLNLAVNARDAMPAGGTIIIRARNDVVASGSPLGLTAGPYVRIDVVDCGSGMDPATLARAIEPFFTTKEVGKGTGLGLSMVHGLMEQMGGRLVLSSTLGEGTRAEMWLPVAGTSPRPTPSVAQESVPERRHPASSPLLVLAVDDDEIVLRNTINLLRDLGHIVFSAASGEAALSLLDQQQACDLVITDYAMPNMTGIELAERIRADRPRLPILLSTGYHDVVADAALPLPRLAKPFTLAALDGAIGQAVTLPPQPFHPRLRRRSL